MKNEGSTVGTRRAELATESTEGLDVKLSGPFSTIVHRMFYELEIFSMGSWNR